MTWSRTHPTRWLDDAWARRGRERRHVQIVTGGARVDIVIGAGIVDTLAGALPVGWRRAVVVTEPGIPPLRAWDGPTIVVPRGEKAKRLRVVEQVAEQLVKLGVSRADGIVAYGGGVVCDLAGFVAATFHRGIGVVNVPTSLLAMVDAGVGGKTGVNLPSGKNLVGAFWQPELVLIDLDLLSTLPARQWRSGLGETVKYSFLGLESLLSLPLDEAVVRSVELKASIVARDERESGERALLNYGHTVGHALEAVAIAQRRRLTHGEAVATGLVAEAQLAYQLGRIDRDRVIYHRDLVRGVGLSSTLPPWAATSDLLEYLQRDKKHRTSLASVLDGPRGLELVEDIPLEHVRRALEEARRL